MFFYYLIYLLMVLKPLAISLYFGNDLLWTLVPEPVRGYVWKEKTTAFALLWGPENSNMSVKINFKPSYWQSGYTFEITHEVCHHLKKQTYCIQKEMLICLQASSIGKKINAYSLLSIQKPTTSYRNRRKTVFSYPFVSHQRMIGDWLYDLKTYQLHRVRFNNEDNE